jgi:fructose-1,6-bisphosphatase/inositol monophosphatase family enzyme
MNTTNHDLHESITQVAVDAARAAGEILRTASRRPRTVDSKSAHDVKLQADRDCEAEILSRIRRAFPEHAILSEESGRDDKHSDYHWIVDPLDGTVNFYYGLPYYCTSIACYATPCNDDIHPESIASLGRPVAGVVYAPATDELFVAQTGCGATLNDEPISATDIQSLSEAVACVGFFMSDEQGGCPLARVSARLGHKVRKIRCLGAAAYDLANVAAGRLSAFYEERLKVWDIAAGAVLLAEAGASLDFRQFQPGWWRTFCAGPGILEEFVHEVLQAESV